GLALAAPVLARLELEGQVLVLVLVLEVHAVEYVGNPADAALVEDHADVRVALECPQSEKRALRPSARYRCCVIAVIQILSKNRGTTACPGHSFHSPSANANAESCVRVCMASSLKTTSVPLRSGRLREPTRTGPIAERRRAGGATRQARTTSWAGR